MNREAGAVEYDASTNAVQRAEYWKAEHAAANKEIERLKGQLPIGMEHCTILFKECARGHGRLTATNWIDHGCYVCALDSAELDLRKEREKHE